MSEALPMPLTPLEARVQLAGHGRDAELRHGSRKKTEGIVHTPPELARFVARSVDELIVRELGLTRGLADPNVVLIDPACGPGAFLAAAHAVAAQRASAPAAVVGLDRDAAALEQCRSAFAAEQWPLTLRCEDTLRETDVSALTRLGEHVVVIGNPPWIGSAQPTGVTQIDGLLEELRQDEHGVRLQERKLGVLADAYVRFLALTVAIARSARGGAVIGLVTNSSYLDGRVHRGLRRVLSAELDRLHIVDLGGSALLARERNAQDGNVFGVRTPAAMLLAVRRPGPKMLRYTRLVGDVASKLGTLGSTPLSALPARAVEHGSPLFRFVPVRAAPPEYLVWPSLAELMPFHREGVQTNRDAAVIDTRPERLAKRLLAFLRGERCAEMADAERPLAHYDPARARQALQRVLDEAGGAIDSLLIRIAYRPLDTRYFVPVAPLCHRPRADLLRAMRASRFALVIARKDRSAVPWKHIAAAADVVDNSFLSTRSSCRARGVPTHGPDGCENLDVAVASVLMERAGRTLSSHEVACYALARLSEPSYQASYLAWLRSDYPRVPLPESAASFDSALARGERLVTAWCSPLEASPQDGSAAAYGAELVIGHHRVVELLRRRKTAATGQNDRAEQSEPAALGARASLLGALLAFEPENSPR